MDHPYTRRSSERGVVLIHVALGIVALLAFSALVLDYGIMWVGRGQAQNSADAGAMAGAVALAYDDFNDRTDAGPAKLSARRAALDNMVWLQQPSVELADVTFPVCPDGTNGCVRVDVFRNQARANPLPTFLGQLVGVNSQGVRATATAQARAANASDCLKPWAIPDKWLEVQTPDWTPDDTFDKYEDQGPQPRPLLPNPDIYTRPSASGPGTGFTVALDYGTELVLKAGQPQDSLSPGLFFPIDLPIAGGGPITGGDRYRENIAKCNGIPIEIGETLTFEPGNMVGPTTQGVEELIALDPTATWNPTTKKIENSCANSNPACAAFSPRIVAIPVFDVDAWEDGKQNGRVEIVIVNILGFFIAGMQGNDVMGYLMSYPGVLVDGTPTITDESAFSWVITLIR